MSQYLIRSQFDEAEVYQNQTYLAQQQQRKNIIQSIPLMKMSYYDYLIQYKGSIISVNVPDNSKYQQYNEIFKNRQQFEKQIQSFISQNKTNGGSYYFYSWISNDEFCCQVPHDGVPLLATLIFSYDYEKATQLIQKWPKSLITQTLAIFLRGFVNIIKVVQNDPELKNHFFQKKVFFLQPKNSLVETYSPPRLLLIDHPQQITENLMDCYHSPEQKQNCVLQNLNYLKRFLRMLPKNQINDYYNLIFAFMSNTEDQVKSKNIYNMLLQCRELNLMDRLNFAQKLIPFQQRKQFIADFSLKILNLTHLSNLLFFSSNQLEFLERLISNYLDEYGDLHSVAAICLQYGHPKLMKFIDMFQQTLVMSCQQKKAQDLQIQQYKKLGSYCIKKTQKPEPTSRVFLNSVNFQQQKIQPLPQSRTQNRICYVCFRPQDKGQDIFVQCGRCSHGGHLSHLLKWYEQSNHVCPKTDCSCYCV